MKRSFRIAVNMLSWKVALVLALMLFISLSESVGLLMLVPMLQLVGLETGEGSLGQIADLMSRIFEVIGIQPTVVTVIGLYVLVISTRALLSRWHFVAISSLHQDFIANLRQQLYQAITRANWLFYANGRSSTFTQVLTHELERAGGAVHSQLFLLVGVLTASIYLFLALILSPMMTLLVVLCGMLLSLLLLRKTRLARQKGEAVSLAYKDLYAVIGEQLSGMKISKSHGIEGYHITTFARLTRRVADMHINVVSNHADVGFWLAIGSVTILGFMLYVALEVLLLPTAGILLLIFLFARLIPMFSSIQQGYQSFASMLPAFDNVMEMLARCEAAAEPKVEAAKTFRLREQIRFEGVSFQYKKEGVTLHGIDLVVGSGKTTAIVGSSGAGKSTIADLIVGLIVPDQGQVLVDGAPLRPERVGAWRNQLGYVAQDTFLFHDTIRNNLLATYPEASDEDMLKALKLAAAEEIIIKLPEGLDTVVGDRGVLLSGGERQRLALARALLRKPSLLILDEATSSLDSENEQRIRGAIETLHGNMTILIITHRLSTVRNADLIYVLEQGRIVEAGSWDMLLGKNGRFRALCKAQDLLEVKEVAGQV